MSVVRLVAIGGAVIAAVIAATCGDTGPTPGSRLTVGIEQSRSAQARHVLEVRLINEGETPLEVTSLQLIDPRFTEVPENPKTTPVQAGGKPIETPIDYGEAVCQEGVSGIATIAVAVLAEGQEEYLLLFVEPAGEEVLARLHDSECRQRAVAEAVTISFGPRWESTARAVARGQIELSRAATDETVAVEQAAGTVIFTLDVLSGHGSDVVVLEDDQDRAMVDVEISAARCDPHALIESKKTYSFPLWVRLGEMPAQFVVLEPTGAARGTFEQLLAVGCGVGH